ncbi:MAG: dsba oxidoreductase [Parcubacteria group bacterium Gr01-1014_56]|nr:MAG: dsba oxidoreductase [Parcubacteria group bacterium Gr01-1014_56]
MNSQYVLPITIVVAGVLIAGAVFWAGKSSLPTNGGSNGAVSARAYDPAIDHILGNPNAPVKVIEYMDLECPHCKTFQATMHRVMEYYGAGGKVAWVSRAFPLASIHSKAPQEAQAAECAAEQGGDTAYFKFIDRVFEVTPSNNGLDLAQLPVIAKDVGLDVAAFNTCLSSNKYAKKVTDSYNEAIKLGAQGTPYTLIMVGSEAVTLNGNQPYDSMRAAIDAVLEGVSATPVAQ